MLRAIVPVYLIPESMQEKLITRLQGMGMELNLCASAKEALREIVKENSEEAPNALIAIPSLCDDFLENFARNWGLLTITLSVADAKEIVAERDNCKYSVSCRSTIF